MNAAGGTFIAHNADLGTGTQKESAAVIAQILAKAGKIDALINNAGIIRRAPAKDFSEADWNAVIATNLNSPFFLMQAVGKWWIETGRAKASADARLKLVNIASLLSFQGGITVPAYAASKHGIAGVTKALSNEGAHQRQRHRARLHRHGEHEGVARRPSAQQSNRGSHPGRSLGRSGRHRWRLRVSCVGRFRLSQRRCAEHRRRLDGTVIPK